jgi:DeoR family fructose operon transcriptional repressor
LQTRRTLSKLYHVGDRDKAQSRSLAKSDAVMLVEGRRKQVLELVKGRGFITLTDLAREVGVSESTARRDLDHWEGRGVLKRIHGGAMSAEDGQGLPALEARANTQVAAKRRIARTAASRVRDGEAILLDGGTTTLEFARCLIGRPLQIVTNSLPIANLFANSHETDLVILGGYVYPATGVALGPLTIQMMKSLHVQQAFLSVAGITAKGLFNSNPLLVETERHMMRSADEVTVLADHTKVGRQALAYLCAVSAIDTLIIDHELSPGQRKLLRNAGARCVIAGPLANGRNGRRNKA